MELCVDQGNTNTKVAAFHHGELIENALFDDENCSRELKIFLQKHQPSRAILSSVRSEYDDIKMLISGFCTVINMHPSLKMPFGMGYKSPDTIGSDRLANAAAMSRRLKGLPCLAVDFGTCITYTMVVNDSLHGGTIAPGVNMRLKALHHFTGKLPLISFNGQLQDIPGESTKQSIETGGILAAIIETEGMISSYCSKFPGLNVFITGGDMAFFEKHLKSPIFAVPFLTLEGLHEILLLNDN